MRVPTSNVVAVFKKPEQLFIHWGKQLKYQDSFCTTTDIDIFDYAMNNEAVLDFFRETSILDVVIPTRYLRLVNNDGIACFPRHCSKDIPESNPPCAFGAFSKFEPCLTAWLDTNFVNLVMSERFTCKDHNKVS